MFMSKVLKIITLLFLIYELVQIALHYYQKLLNYYRFLKIIEGVQYDFW